MLSDFCKQLTSISQEEVDQAPTFGKAIRNFKNWNGSDYRLVSWGFYDKKQLKMDCELHKESSTWIRNHMSLKHKHGKMIGVERGVGMGKALQMLQIPLEGTHHRGIDDARNIAKIFAAIFEKLELDN
ncbi:exonuclease domain-containing protein [Brevibacillus sp. 179-C9.3 HS]|uniref:exonuclease domain-containing protein n=1 Tax=unclassified Brevibacillus TaxID=2684853 RepID=UPI0039A12FF2